MPDQSTRLVARILREVLTRTAPESIADLKADLWSELRRLQVPAAPAVVDAALDLVGSNTALVRPPARGRAS